MDQNNKEFIIRFYSAFQILNFEEIQKAYHAEAKFYDPIFGDLNSDEVKAMWEMLLTKSQDLQVAFSNVNATMTDGQCRWEAWYTFSKTRRFVHNVIHSTFEFKEGKIYRQRDSFSLWRWSRHSLGMVGLFLGWSPLVQNKVKTMARDNLKKFMQNSQAKAGA